MPGVLCFLIVTFLDLPTCMTLGPSTNSIPHDGGKSLLSRTHRLNSSKPPSLSNCAAYLQREVARALSFHFPYLEIKVVVPNFLDLSLKINWEDVENLIINI